MSVLDFYKLGSKMVEYFEHQLLKINMDFLMPPVIFKFI